MKPKENKKAGNGLRMDQCQTPSYGVAPILPYLAPGTRVWEPATGEGYLADALDKHGCTTIRTDWITGQDFFRYAPDPSTYDVIVTNPPYSLKYDWMQRCYALGKPWALLVPLETIGAGKAQAMFRQHGFEVLLLDRRINFKMPNKGWDGSAQFPVCWLCWRLLPQQIVLGRVPKAADSGQISLFDLVAA